MRSWDSGMEHAGFMYEGVEEGVALQSDQRCSRFWERMRWRWGDERAEWEAFIEGESCADRR